MAAQSRGADPALRQELVQEGYRFGFFQAVRLLQRMNPKRHPIGEAVRPAEEVVRFRARQSLSFPPSEIYGIQPPESDDRPSEMTVAFMGLTGPSGVLPRHYTELMLERLRQKDYTLRDFFDVFNHRMIALFYRAWEKHHHFVGFERALTGGAEDRFALDLFALMGFGTKGVREQLDMEPRSLLRYTGLLAQRPHTAEALQHCLADLFQIPVAIQQFIGGWHELAEEDRTRLGGVGWNNVLGQTALAGTNVWDQQTKFQVQLGPLEFQTFYRLLPSGKAYPTLVQLTKCFAGLELEFDINLVLKAEEVPYCRLRQSDQYSPRLGWTTWLTTQACTRNAEDVRFAGSATPALVANAQ